MADKFSKQFGQLSDPARDGYAVTPGNTVFTQPTRAVYVGGTGNVCVQMAGSSNAVLTFVAVPAGSFLPIRVVSIFANSTATSIIGLY